MLILRSIHEHETKLEQVRLGCVRHGWNKKDAVLDIKLNGKAVQFFQMLAVFFYSWVITLYTHKHMLKHTLWTEEEETNTSNDEK